MSIGRFSVNNRVFVNLSMLLFITIGVLSYRTMPKEVFPIIPMDRITITTTYTGVSPEEIEKIITVPQENAIQTVSGIDEINSRSSEGISQIMVKLETGRDLKKVSQDINSALNRMDPLPEDAEEPVVIEIESRFPVCNVSVYGNAKETVLRELSDELEERIKKIKGVGEIIKSGYRDREIWVEIDPLRLDAYNLSLNDVVLALERRNLNLPGGSIKGVRREYLVRTVGEFENPQEVLNTVIKKGLTDRGIEISDVAKVTETFEEASTFGRVNGARAITLIVSKKINGDTIKIVNEIKKIRTEFEKLLPPGVSIALTQDSSIWIRNRLKTLYSSGTIGFILVCLILLVFLNWRFAFLTAFGIPLSFLGAFIFMKFFGMTINMISLFSLIVVLGMIVDDAIIVSENSYRHLGMGLSARQAAIRGTDQVVVPVTAAILTTVVAFAPMLMMSGQMGKVMQTIPMVVIFALAASLFEAFLTLPSHLADFSPKKLKTHKQRFYRTKVFFRKIVSFCLRIRYLVILLTVVVAAFFAYVAKEHIPFVLFSSRDIPSFYIQVETPDGSTLSFTESVIAEIETRLLTLPENEIDDLTTMVGSHFDPGTGQMDTGTNMAQVTVELPDFGDPNRVNGYVVMEHARNLLKGIRGVKSIRLNEVQGGPPKGKAVELQIRGKNIEVLKAISKNIKEFLKQQPGVHDVKDDLIEGKKELIFTLNEQKASLFDLDVQAAAVAVRTAFDGMKTSEIHKQKDEIDVVAMLAPEFRNDMQTLSYLRVENRQGKLIPLSSAGNFELKQGTGVIRRKDQKRAITVTANVDDNITTSTEVNSLIEQRFSNIPDRYPGYSFAFAGEQEEQRESLESLMDAFVFAIISAYIILGTLFRSFLQPFVVIFAVPFAFIGVVVGHLVMDIPFGLLSIIGFVALVGIVVNDSLVLVDYINKERRQGVDQRTSIINAAEVRLRPIVLTSLTTIGGISTIAFKTTGQAAFLAPMAISIFWGLIFSTVLTLLVIPSAFAILDDLINLFYTITGITYEDDTKTESQDYVS